MDALQRCNWRDHRALWSKGCAGDLRFLRAGQHHDGSLSIRPREEGSVDDGMVEEEVCGVESEADDEGIEGEVIGEVILNEDST